METSNVESRLRIPSWAKKIIPFLVSAFILFYYFHKQDWQGIFAAASRVNFTIAVLAIMVPQMVLWLFEVLIAHRHIEWFHEPASFKTFFWVRGAIYLLIMLNPSLGLGGFVVYIWRKTGITWSKMLGIVIFRYGLLFWGICVLLIPTALALHRYGLYENSRTVIWVWWGILLFGLIWMIDAWFYWHHKKSIGISSLVVRNPEKDVWTAFRLATKKQWLLTWALEVPSAILYVTGIFFLSRAFNVRVPYLEFMVLSPFVIAIGDMPVAFAGFGSTTLAFFTFFGDYGSAETITALTLFFPFARATIRVLIGLVSLKPAITDVNILLQKSSVKQG
jgi:hypothetical protein